MGVDDKLSRDTQAIKAELNSNDSQQVKAQKIHDELKTYMEDYAKLNSNSSAGAWTALLSDVQDRNSKDYVESFLPNIVLTTFEHPGDVYSKDQLLRIANPLQDTDPVNQFLAQQFLLHFDSMQDSSGNVGANDLEKWAQKYAKSVGSDANAVSIKTIDSPTGQLTDIRSSGCDVKFDQSGHVVEVDDLANNSKWLWTAGHWHEHKLDAFGYPLLDQQGNEIIGASADLLNPTGNPFANQNQNGLVFQFLDGTSTVYLADGRRLNITSDCQAATSGLYDLLVNKNDGKSFLAVLNTENREKKDAIEWLYQQRYGHSLLDDVQKHLSSTDLSKALIAINEGDSTADTFDSVQMMLGKLPPMMDWGPGMPDPKSSDWVSDLGNAQLSDVERGNLGQIIGTMELNDGAPIVLDGVIAKISPEQQAAEAELRATFSVLSKAQIDDLRKQYASHNQDLDSLLLSNPNISPWTKAALKIYLKGTDQRSADDTYSLINIGLHSQNIAVFEEAFAGVSKEQLQQLLLLHPDLRSRLSQSFQYDNLQSAKDCLNTGTVSAVTQISRDLGDDKALLRDCTNISPYEQKLFQNGWNLVQDYADLQRSKDSKWQAPDELTLRNQAIQYYENGDGKNSLTLEQKASLDYYKQFDDALRGKGENQRLALESSVLFKDSTLLSTISDGHWSSWTRAYGNDVTKIITSINNMKESDWNLYSGYGAASDRFRRLVDAELNSLGLSTSERAQINQILDFKRQAPSYLESQECWNIVSAVNLYHNDLNQVVNAVLNMSPADMQAYKAAKALDPNGADPNNFATRLDSLIQSSSTNDENELHFTFRSPGQEIARLYLKDVCAASDTTIKSNLVVLDPVAKMLYSYLHGGSPSQLVQQLKSSPDSQAAFANWLGLDDKSGGHATQQDIFEMIMNRTMTGYNTALDSTLLQQAHDHYPGASLTDQSLVVASVILDANPVPADFLIGLSSQYNIQEKFDSLKLICDSDRTRILTDSVYRDKVFAGLDDQTKQLFLNALAHEIRGPEGNTFAAADIAEAYIRGLKTLNDVQLAFDTSKMTEGDRANFLKAAQASFAESYQNTSQGGDLAAALLSKCSTDQDRLAMQKMLDVKPRNDLRDYLSLVDYADSSYGGIDIAARADEVRKAEAAFKNLIIEESKGQVIDKSELDKVGTEWIESVKAYAEAKGASAEQVKSLVIMAAAMLTIAASGGASLPVLAALAGEGALLNVTITKAMMGSDWDSDPKSVLSRVFGGAFEAELAALSPAEIAGWFGIGDELASAVIGSTVFEKPLTDEAAKVVEGSLGDVFREAFTTGEKITGQKIGSALAQVAADASTDPKVAAEIKQLLADPATKAVLDNMADQLAKQAPLLAEKGLGRALDFIARHGAGGAIIGGIGGGGGMAIQGAFNFDSTRSFGDNLNSWLQGVGQGVIGGAEGGAMMSVVLAGGQKILIYGAKGGATYFGAQGADANAPLQVKVGDKTEIIEPGTEIPEGATDVKVLSPALAPSKSLGSDAPSVVVVNKGQTYASVPGETVIAGDGSLVFAGPDSKTVGMPNSEIDAGAGSLVSVGDNTKVFAGPKSLTIVYGDSAVDAQAGADVVIRSSGRETTTATVQDNYNGVVVDSTVTVDTPTANKNLVHLHSGARAFVFDSSVVVDAEPGSTVVEFLKPGDTPVKYPPGVHVVTLQFDPHVAYNENFAEFAKVITKLPTEVLDWLHNEDISIALAKSPGDLAGDPSLDSKAFPNTNNMTYGDIGAWFKADPNNPQLAFFRSSNIIAVLEEISHAIEGRLLGDSSQTSGFQTLVKLEALNIPSEIFDVNSPNYSQAIAEEFHYRLPTGQIWDPTNPDALDGACREAYAAAEMCLFQAELGIPLSPGQLKYVKSVPDIMQYVYGDMKNPRVGLLPAQDSLSVQNLVKLWSGT